jgi:hypothetical protein
MPASAPARARTHGGRSTVVPRHHRRISGPARSPVRPVARPVPAGPAVRGRQRTSAFERLRALPEHRFVDKLLRSRAWIVVVALMLGGIVAMQVSLLKLNAGISRAVETSATLERQNADMQDTIARLSSGERVRTAATTLGMVAPPAGDVGFLTSRGSRDDAIAAQRLTPPSDEAKAVMANGGHDPNAVAAAPAAATTPAPAAATTPAPTPVPTATPDPAAATATSVDGQG